MRSLIRLVKIFALVCALFVIDATGTANVHAANIHLTWEGTSDNEDGFKIERLLAGAIDGSFTVGAKISSYIDSGLSPGILYCYVVRAYNSAGDSDPSNEVCTAAEETTTTVSPTTEITSPPSLAVSPTTVIARGTIDTMWSGIAVPSPTDWIGMYLPGSADRNFLDWIYVSCSKIPATARPSGSCSYVLPATFSLGNYELRLFANDGFTRLATSALTVSEHGTVTPPDAQTPSLTVSPTTVPSNAAVTATWSGITSPNPTDWVGLYAPGTAERDFIDYMYVSCSYIPNRAPASGACSFPIPVGVQGGTYELRLFGNDGYIRLATSNSLTVTSSSGTAVGPPRGPSGLAIQTVQ